MGVKIRRDGQVGERAGEGGRGLQSVAGVIEPGHLLRGSFHGPVWLTGGTVGPEGSVLVFVVIALMWAMFDRLYPNEASPATMLASDQ